VILELENANIKGCHKTISELFPKCECITSVPTECTVIKRTSVEMSEPFVGLPEYLTKAVPPKCHKSYNFMLADKSSDCEYPMQALFQFHDMIYFMVVTVTTVGYGDIAPVTTEGRMSVIVIIMVIIGLFPN
jgi:hypothetical protein